MLYNVSFSACFCKTDASFGRAGPHESATDPLHGPPSIFSAQPPPNDPRSPPANWARTWTFDSPEHVNDHDHDRDHDHGAWSHWFSRGTGTAPPSASRNSAAAVAAAEREARLREAMRADLGPRPRPRDLDAERSRLLGNLPSGMSASEFMRAMTGVDANGAGGASAAGGGQRGDRRSAGAAHGVRAVGTTAAARWPLAAAAHAHFGATYEQLVELEVRLTHFCKRSCGVVDMHAELAGQDACPCI